MRYSTVTSSDAALLLHQRTLRLIHCRCQYNALMRHHYSTGCPACVLPAASFRRQLTRENRCFSRWPTPSEATLPVSAAASLRCHALCFASLAARPACTAEACSSLVGPFRARACEGASMSSSAAATPSTNNASRWKRFIVNYRRYRYVTRSPRIDAWVPRVKQRVLVLLVFLGRLCFHRSIDQLGVAKMSPDQYMVSNLLYSRSISLAVLFLRFNT